jgi:hypothetical protein
MMGRTRGMDTNQAERAIVLLAAKFEVKPGELVAAVLELWAFDDTNLEECRALRTAAYVLRKACSEGEHLRTLTLQ